jgi:hypothetical protein
MATLTNAHNELFKRNPDEHFSSFEKLFDVCKNDKELSLEQWASPCDVKPVALDGELCLELPNKEPLHMNHWSFGQLCTLSGVNKGTLNKLSVETAKQALVETMPGGAKPLQVFGKNEHLRSIHGTSYGRLYDADLLELVREYANEFRPPPTADGGTAGLYRGPEDMFVFLINSACWVEIGKELFAPGLFLWNSEVGRRTVGVSTFYWQAVCQNHIVWNSTDVTEFCRKHTANVGEAFEDIRRILDDFAQQRANRKDGFMDAVERAMQAKLPAEAEKVISLLRKQGIPQHLAKEATGMAMKKGAVTLWNIVDALTQLAGKIPNAGERTQIDQQAGQLLSAAV